jgi:hypothetical protein
MFYGHALSFSHLMPHEAACLGSQQGLTELHVGTASRLYCNFFRAPDWRSTT